MTATITAAAFDAAHEAEAARLGVEITNLDWSGDLRTKFLFDPEKDDWDNTRILVHGGGYCSKTSGGYLTTAFEGGEIVHNFTPYGPAIIADQNAA
jgi:hypothetical protein